MADGSVPVLAFLDAVPSGIRARLIAVLTAVAAGPPPTFSGGGKWEAMHGAMGGWYEIRCAGPGRVQYRLFCLLENGAPEELAALGYDGPSIVVVTGLCKGHRTTFDQRDYQRVRALGHEYRSAMPRRFS